MRGVVGIGVAGMGRKSRAKAASRAERARQRESQSAPSVADAAIATRSAPAGRLLLSSRLREFYGGQVRNREPKPTLPVTPVGQWKRRHVECERLRELVTDLTAARLAVDTEIRALRERGASWTDIGNAIGLSRQGARQRYIHLQSEA
jgi:hypothetical protein